MRRGIKVRLIAFVLLSALGMVSAAESVDVSQTTLQLERDGKLDDDRLYAEFGRLNALAMDRLPSSDPQRGCPLMMCSSSPRHARSTMS